MSGKRSNRKNHQCILGCGTMVAKPNRRCLKCYINQQAQKSIKPKLGLNKSASSAKLYPCSENCGKFLSEEGQKCFQCKKTRRDKIASSANQKTMITKAMKSLISGSSHGVMLVGDEIWALSSICPWPGCPKPVLVSSRCYEHATGRPVTLGVSPRIMLREEVLAGDDTLLERLAYRNIA